MSKNALKTAEQLEKVSVSKGSEIVEEMIPLYLYPPMIRVSDSKGKKDFILM